MLDLGVDEADGLTSMAAAGVEIGADQWECGIGWEAEFDGFV
jgi:hypothetical protein